MGPGIIIPVLLIGIVIPLAYAWARRTLRDGGRSATADAPPPPSARLSSAALRALPSPPWRIVHEIPESKLGGIDHVLIGPAGAFAVRTSLDPLPEAPTGAADPHVVAEAAIARGGLDDALRRCGMSCERLVTLHWGPPTERTQIAVETAAGATAVDGRAVDQWVATLPGGKLSPAQVDLAWQTVLTAIGRPDPLP